MHSCNKIKKSKDGTIDDHKELVSSSLKLVFGFPLA